MQIDYFFIIIFAYNIIEVKDFGYSWKLDLFIFYIDENIL